MRDKIGNFTLKNFQTSSKFCLYLVILLFAISLQTTNAIPVHSSGHRLVLHTQQYRERRYQQLLQEQRSLVVPTPHRHHLHHRSVGIMQKTTNSDRGDGTGANGNDMRHYCDAIETAEKLIRKAQAQANATFYNFLSYLGSYTKAKHNQTVDKWYEQWSKHSLGLKHPYAKYINRNINVKPKDTIELPEHLVGQEITNETLITEFLNINKTLTILDNVYQEKMRERNVPRARFDLRRENESEDQYQERKKILDNMFESVYGFLKQDLFHTRNILKSLNVQRETDFEVSYNKEAQQAEWLLIQEHLSIMKYLIEIYNFLLEPCNRAS